MHAHFAAVGAQSVNSATEDVNQGGAKKHRRAGGLPAAKAGQGGNMMYLDDQATINRSIELRPWRRLCLLVFKVHRSERNDIVQTYADCKETMHVVGTVAGVVLRDQAYARKPVIASAAWAAVRVSRRSGSSNLAFFKTNLINTLCYTSRTKLTKKARCLRLRPLSISRRGRQRQLQPHPEESQDSSRSRVGFSG